MNSSQITFLAALVAPLFAIAQSPDPKKRGEPIIDMHLHALNARWWGGWHNFTYNVEGLTVPESEEALMQQSFARMREFNIVRAFTSGNADTVEKWHAAEPDRIIRSVMIYGTSLSEQSLAQLEKRHAEGKLAGLGEVVTQYYGFAADDPALEPLFAFAERLDLPIGIHMGLGPPGVSQDKFPKFRMSRASALLLEPVLVRHPKLRVFVMHAGWPLLDDMVALLWGYPSVYVDISWINWHHLPRAEFHHYLRRLMNAGFGKRVMYGSDQMIWPEAIAKSIEAVESADFLTPQQKRDIFYHNAAKFLRLSAAEIARHHGRGQE